MSLLGELKRRRVFRVAGVYAAVAFVVWQAADIAFPALHLPGWMVTAVVALTIIGFPIAVVLAWAFDVTPEGVVRTDAQETHVVVSRSTFRTQRIAAAAGILVLALAGGAFVVFSDRDAGRDGDVPVEIERSIGVLPFANLSGDADNEYFSDGITEDVLTHLSKIAELKVISRSSVMAYKGTTRRLREIGAELGVAHILEGSVRRDGSRVRISAQLVDARTDRQLWAETYDRELTGIFEIQSEIAQQIARALRARLTPAEQARLATVQATDLSAYELYLKVRDQRNAQGEHIREEKLALLSEALRLDPRFAPAYAEYVSVFLPLYGSMQAELDSAARLARRAIELAPEHASGYVALGTVLRRAGQIDDAGEAYRRAFALAPNDVDAIGGMGWTHALRGEHDEALRWRRLAAELDPGIGFRHRQLGNTYESLGEYERARRAYERASSLNSGIWFFHNDLARLYLRSGDTAAAVMKLQHAMQVAVEPTDRHGTAAAIALARADTAAAIRHLEEVNADGTRQFPPLQLGLLYWQRNERAHAERIFAAYERGAGQVLADSDRAGVLYELAVIHALRGKYDAAVAQLERARGARVNASAFESLPLPQRVHDDPRVRRIREAVLAERERQRERARREGWL
jgi:TolB-like protein/Flp pilus assembly protein TadD